MGEGEQREVLRPGGSLSNMTQKSQGAAEAQGPPYGDRKRTDFGW